MARSDGRQTGLALFLRQLYALVYKNLLIVLIRHPFTTVLRALVLPLVFGWFISYARNFFVPPATYGIGTPHLIPDLQQALTAVPRERLVFVNNGFTGGEIERIINVVSDQARDAGKEVDVVAQENDLLTLCKSSLRGATNCVAGVIFYSSPSEPAGEGKSYNYTLKFDGALGGSPDVDSDGNDAETFVMPLQRAIDTAILDTNSTDQKSLRATAEYPYTSLSQAQRATDIRTRYNGALITTPAVAFFVGICGIQYQQVGAQATERETKMAQLVEVMMPNRRRWEPQVARLASYHISFSLLYLPGWIGMALILREGVFANTNVGIVVVTHLLIGWSLASFSLFGASFFKRAQLSGITVILVSLVLAIIAQVYDDASETVVIVCSLLFPSMCYTYLIILIARFEQNNIGMNLVQSAPDDLWALPGIALWAFLIAQIFIYPLLAAWIERVLWGTTSSDRQLTSNEGAAVELNGFSKRFTPNWFELWVLPLFGKSKGSRKSVLAVDDLTLTVLPGQISVLLGANGCGKSTTLDAIAGLSKPTTGTISLDFRNGLGLCPQQNVHWKNLTVYEHIQIFDMLKSTGSLASRAQNSQLIEECDLKAKLNTQAGALSGGQMRKLQLASMFTGGSQICLIDECSSGIDPIARQKIQKILLEERRRSNRTMIFTSHYLDEAEIADYILIMSKGRLKLQGTAPEIKQSGQYRVHVYRNSEKPAPPVLQDYPRRDLYDQSIYSANSASETASIIAKLEQVDYRDYTVSGPTVEDAFMKVSEEMLPALKRPGSDDLNNKSEDSTSAEERLSDDDDSARKLDLSDGSHIGPFKQGMVLLRKRQQVFFRNVFPNLTALLLIPIAAGLTSLFLQGFQRAGCTPTDQVSASDLSSLSTQLENQLDLVVGPSSAVNFSTFELILSTLEPTNSSTQNGGSSAASPSSNYTGLIRSIHIVDTITQFNDYINQNYHNVTPGGFFIGDGSNPSTMAWEANRALAFPIYVQNMVNTITTNIPITTQYSYFDIPWTADQGNSLQFVVYFALVLAVAPGFFALYPTLERLRRVRGLHYSNGVRALPLWLAYTIFDFMFILIGTSIGVGVLSAAFSPLLFGLGCLWVTIVLFLLCATLFSYVVSLFATSQLGAFAIAAAYQAVSAVVYMIAYLSTLTYGMFLTLYLQSALISVAPIALVDQYLLVVHFSLAVIFPSASLLRGLFVSVNILSVNCRGISDYVATPGDITAYGGPIVYLIVQILLQFAFLIWWESGNNFKTLFSKAHRATDVEEKHAPEPEVAEELDRVTDSTTDGLRVLHLTKAFGSTLAVDDISFGVKRGEVFGLLGPNGAGKSTTISVIRGDLKPSNNDSDIFIENISLRKKKAIARQHLSACPQHDAMDRLTVTEHLQFYARIRGVANVAHNVEEVIRAVGLTRFKSRMGDALSGGNKRKLSLGIALMGNPAVMLLDEPSSGMDVAAKRVMWRTLEAVVPGRSIVLTTHSMEEADRLCSRAGILAKRMLAIGTSDYLRKKHGDRYYVHLLLNSAPHTTAEEAARAAEWVEYGKHIPGAKLEGGIFHGQVRFSVPARSELASKPDFKPERESGTGEIWTDAPETKTEAVEAERQRRAKAMGKPEIEADSPLPARGGVGSLFETLEKCKQELGFEYYSVSQTTLDQVFLSIVSKHNVEEENMGTATATRSWRGRLLKAVLRK